MSKSITYVERETNEFALCVLLMVLVATAVVLLTTATSHGSRQFAGHAPKTEALMAVRSAG